jgi:hypothetical protein
MSKRTDGRPSCLDCTYFDKKTAVTNLGKVEIDICRLHPPKVSAGNTQSGPVEITSWPRVDREYDWCGEFDRYL